MNKISLPRIIVAGLLFIIGGILVFNVPIRNAYMKYQTSKFQIEHVSRKKIEVNSKKKVSYDYSTIRAISTPDVVKSDTTNLAVVGGIAIPDVGINLPIFKGMGNSELTYGVGTMKPEQEMGSKTNYALASHHVFGISGADKMLFSPLVKAKTGMTIYLTDKASIYTYKITNISVVTPEHVEVVYNTPNKAEVTLVTCTDAEATKRTIIRGEYQSKVAFNHADKAMSEAFNKGYNLIN